MNREEMLNKIGEHKCGYCNNYGHYRQCKTAWGTNIMCTCCPDCSCHYDKNSNQWYLTHRGFTSKMGRVIR